jgi:FkbM family methyltransferase
VIRYLKELYRWHIEKHFLRFAAPVQASGLQLIDVGEMLLPAGLVDRSWICYCAGVGEDIRLERFIADDLGAHVWAFDPTPRAIAYMETAAYNRAKLHMMPVGLWNTDTTLRFHAPANPAHVSHSVREELGGQGFFEAPCRSIPSIMRELGHDRVDLLKMNIEGAEDVVLAAMLDAGVRPRVIITTFEGSRALTKTRDWTARLRANGFQLVGREGWCFTYVRGER